MNAGRTIFRNFLSLTFSNAVSKAFGLMTVVYLARVLGPEDFGAMNFALALVSYFAILAHLGLGTVGIRELAQRQAGQGDYINANISLKLVLGLASFTLLAAFAFFMPQGRELKLLTAAYGLTMFTANVLTFDWVFQGIERMEFLGAAAVLQGLVYLGAVLLFVGGSADLPRIPFLLLAAQAAAVLFMFLSYRRLDPGYSFRFVPEFSKEVFRQTLPVAVWGVMTIVVLNSGVTILGFTRGTQEVGYFSAAYKIIWILVEALVAYAAAVFPAISKHYLHNPETFKKIMDVTLKWMAIVSYPAITGLFMLADPIIHLIYGDKFLEAGLLLKVLAVLPYLIFLNNIFSFSLLAAHKQNKNLWISFTQALLSVALGLLLIPVYGSVGLAASFVASYGVTNAVYYFQTRAVYTVPLRQSLKPLAASALMALLLAALGGRNVFLLIGAGAAAYAAALLLLKGVTKEDLALLARTAGFGRDGGAA
jgi:O-antigen/teichoic acid export membrane protein